MTLSSTVRRATPWTGVAVGLLIGAFAEREAVGGHVFSTADVVADSVVGVTALVAALAICLRRPQSRVGPLLMLMGILWFPGTFGYSHNQALVDLVGFPLQGWQDVLLVALVLLFPTGRPNGRGAVFVLCGVTLSHLVLSLDRLLLRPPEDISSCFCVPNRILPISDPSAYTAVARVASVSEAIFALGALGLVGWRWHSATGPARRAWGYVTAAAVAAAALVTYNRLQTALTSDTLQTSATTRLVLDAIRVALPLGVATALLRTARSRGRVADLVVALSSSNANQDRRLFRHALRDPNLQLVRRGTGEAGYYDADNRQFSLPGDSDPSLTTTLVARDGVVLGALVHDRALREEPELLEAVRAAASLALHNERLAHEVQAQLDEVSASRRRIVEVAEGERRRLERDLHDGAQQQLLALTLEARRLERRPPAERDELVARLRTLTRKAEMALEQVRELARGIRPPVLTESGLIDALEGLADTCPVPMMLDVHLPVRLPDTIEATAYFVVSEALANVIKHAHATRVRLHVASVASGITVSVVDDGCGGANPTLGTGLSGLADRLAALGGHLVVDSHPRRGTRVTGHLPLPGPPEESRSAGKPMRVP